MFTYEYDEGYDVSYSVHLYLLFSTRVLPGKSDSVNIWADGNCCFASVLAFADRKTHVSHSIYDEATRLCPGFDGCKVLCLILAQYGERRTRNEVLWAEYGTTDSAYWVKKHRQDSPVRGGRCRWGERQYQNWPSAIYAKRPSSIENWQSDTTYIQDEIFQM